jgi:hypothetical protein
MNAAEVADPRPAVRRGARWPWFVAVALVLLAGLGLTHTYLALLADRRLREAVAEADHLDPGCRLEDLEEARAPVPEAENAAPRVLAASGRLPPPGLLPGDLLLLDGPLAQLAPTQPLHREQLATLRTALESARAAVDEGRQLADYGRGRYTLTWGPGLLMTPLPHVDAGSLLNRFLTYDLLVRLQDGDVEGALRTCQAQFQVARSLGDEACAVTQMVRLWRTGEALAQVERCLAQGQTTAATLERLQRLAEEEASQPVALRVARGYRALLHAALRNVQDGTAGVGTLQSLFDRYELPPGSNVSPKDVWHLRLPGALKSNHAALLKYLTRYVEIARLPLEEQGPALDELAAAPGKQAILVRVTSPGPALMLRNCQGGVARLRCAATLLAVERFRLARGRWPVTLDELVPAQLARVPTDPFDGKPLRYRRLADGVVIYSVGPDGTDDGGNLSRAFEAAAGTDVGFRLWDVAARRLSAPEAERAK